MNCIVGNQENELIRDKFILYPNPAKTHFYVKSFSHKQHHFELRNTIGQLIFEDNFTDKYTVNSSGLASGLYFVRIDNETIKIIITN